MSEYLTIIAIGLNCFDIAHRMTELIYSAHCEIESTHMHQCGSEFTMIFLVSGNWNVIAKLETALDDLQAEMKCDIIYKRTMHELSKHPGMPYLVQMVAPYDACILSEMIVFFTEQKINIREVTGYRYIAQQTGAQMFNLQMIVELPFDTNISDLREQFMLFCEGVNIDATIEPDKL